jgi:hypothetical protein
MRTQVNEIEEVAGFDPFLGPKTGTNRKPVKIRLFDRLTVSRWFRNEVANTFPALGNNETDWRMMQYLLFGAATDENSKKLLLAHEFLAEIAGHKGNSSNFKSGAFLERFRDTHFSTDTFTWTPHVAATKCRQVERWILPAPLQRALEAEYAREHYESGRVYFATGLAFNKDTQRKDRRSKQDASKQCAAEAQTREAREILEYLNNLPPHQFNRIVFLNLDAAVETATSLANENTKKQQLDILKHIQEQPQPFYRPVHEGNTDRIFGVGPAITALKREVRNALIEGWTKADLKSSQLAINAMLWDVQEVTAFLRTSKRSIWEALSEHFDLRGDEADRAKPALKTALYATCYGMGVRKIGSNLTKDLAALGIRKNGNLFLRHPLIKALLTGRRRMVKKIQRESGGRTCFGKWLDTFELTVPQVLAQISQAIELRIMHAVFELAKTTSDFTITLFQHDGIAVHFTDKSKCKAWKKRMSDAVAREAQHFGVETFLDWESEPIAARIF